MSEIQSLYAPMQARVLGLRVGRTPALATHNDNVRSKGTEELSRISWMKRGMVLTPFAPMPHFNFTPPVEGISFLEL